MSLMENHFNFGNKKFEYGKVYNFTPFNLAGINDLNIRFAHNNCHNFNDQESKIILLNIFKNINGVEYKNKYFAEIFLIEKNIKTHIFLEEFVEFVTEL